MTRNVTKDDRSDEDEYEDHVDLGSDFPEGIDKDPKDPEGEEASGKILEQGLSDEQGMDYDQWHSPWPWFSSMPAQTQLTQLL